MSWEMKRTAWLCKEFAPPCTNWIQSNQTQSQQTSKQPSSRIRNPVKWKVFIYCLM